MINQYMGVVPSTFQVVEVETSTLWTIQDENCNKTFFFFMKFCQYSHYVKTQIQRKSRFPGRIFYAFDVSFSGGVDGTDAAK